jgi:Tfp pilus assembly protein PilX
MNRHKDETGAALIMLIGVTTVLALLSATLVLAIQNQQAATAHERVSTQSFYAAEAALDSAAQFAKVDQTMPTTSASEWLTETELRTAFADAFPVPDDATVEFRVYDNLTTVDYDVTWDQNTDGRMWVEAEVTYPGETGKTTRTRCLIEQSQVPFAEALPKAVTYSDTGIRLEDTSDIYAVDPDTGLPVNDPSTSYQTNITAGGTWMPTQPPEITDAAKWAEVGRFTMNSTSDLRAPGSSYQSLGITVNGSVKIGNSVRDHTNPLDDGDLTLGGRTLHRVTIHPGTVGFLSDYFDQKAQASLELESQKASALKATTTGATTVAPSKFTPSQITTIPGVTRIGSASPYTYRFANNIALSGDLTLKTSGSGTGVFPARTTFEMRSVYTNYHFAVSGRLTLKTTKLYVGKNFTITGPTNSSEAVTHSLGCVFVKATPADSTNGGNVTWNGFASVTSDDYTTAEVDPQPMWMGRKWTRTGDFDDEYGPTWVPGNSQLSVDFNSTAPSTITCPLLCTTEQNVWKGSITYGSREKPMVFFFMCDNNGIYPMVFQYEGTGTYYGLMVINESTINVSNGISTKPSIQGAIFAGCPYDPSKTSGLSPSDIVVQDGSCIAYDQYVVGKIATSSLKTTTLVTGIVPGSWQQLSVNGD